MSLLKRFVFPLMVLDIYSSLSTVFEVEDKKKISQIYENLLGFDFDLEYVTKEYLKVCPHLEKCRDGDASFSDMVTERESNKLPFICPTCSCDQDCLINDECCPNVIYGYLKYDCVSSVKRKGESWYNKTSFYMIASCPQSWLARNNLSEQNGSVIPVTSYTTGLTYRAKEFAECNGDDQSLVMWNTTFHCLDRGQDGWPLVINTFEELVINLQERNCEIRLSVTNPKVPRQAVCNGELYLKEKTDFKIKEIVNNCNTTGFWEKFDPYIDFACRRLSLTFGNYKNVFCYMCNPGLSIRYHLKRPFISTCDSTYSKSMTENACITGEINTYHLPYENVFCRLCNIAQYPFVFASSGLQETWINVQNMDENIVAKTIGRLFRIESSCKSMTRSDDGLYFKTLLHETIRFYQTEYSCNIPLHIQINDDSERNNELRECNRNDSQKVREHVKAQFYDCSDFLERYQIAKETVKTDTSNAKEWLLFSYILHTYLCNDSVKLNNICESYITNGTNASSTSQSESGKSLSCFVCSAGDVYAESFYDKSTGFDLLIRVVCPTLLQAGLLQDTFSLFAVILDNDCSLWFYPAGVRDPSFVRILENENDCIDFPWIDKRTCKNFDANNYHFGSYRKLFSVPNTDWTALLQVKKRQRSSDLLECSELIDLSTINTNNSCREIFCSDGHVLVNDTCRSEFETYGNVLYGLDFHLEVTEIEKRTALVIDASTDQAIALKQVKDVCENVQDLR